MPIVYSKNPSKNTKVAKVEKLPSGGTRALWPYIFATYREVGSTCHMRCAFHPGHGDDNRRVHGELCYATKGRVTMHAKKGTPDASDGDTVYRMVQGLPPGVGVRHHVSGDVYDANGVLDWAYFERLVEAHEARPDVRGWLYTHAPLVDFLRMQERAKGTSLAVNWSCDDLDEAREHQAKGATGLTAVVARAIKVDGVVVLRLDNDSPRMKGVTLCPEQTSGIPCADCKLCWNDERKTIVGFIAH
jgi:hypothetical protein